VHKCDRSSSETKQIVRTYHTETRAACNSENTRAAYREVIAALHSRTLRSRKQWLHAAPERPRRGSSEPRASAQEDEAAAQLAKDVHVHGRAPHARDQLEEADVVVEEAVVADEAAPAAAGEATAEPVAAVADVPLPLAADPLEDDLPAGRSQVLRRKL
jgi:hypothetical protein